MSLQEEMEMMRQTRDLMEREAGQDTRKIHYYLQYASETKCWQEIIGNDGGRSGNLRQHEQKNLKQCVYPARDPIAALCK